MKRSENLKTNFNDLIYLKMLKISEEIDLKLKN